MSNSLNSQLNSFFLDQSIGQDVKETNFISEFFTSDAVLSLCKERSVSQFPTSQYGLTQCEKSLILSYQRSALNMPQTLSLDFLNKQTQVLRTKLQTFETTNKGKDQLFQNNTEVTVYYNCSIYKAKVLLVFPQKNRYLVRLAKSTWKNNETKVVTVPHTNILSGDFDERSLASIACAVRHCRTFQGTMTLVKKYPQLDFTPRAIYRPQVNMPPLDFKKTTPLQTSSAYERLSQIVKTERRISSEKQSEEKKPRKSEKEKNKKDGVCEEAIHLAEIMKTLICEITTTIQSKKFITKTQRNKLIKKLPEKFRTNQQVETFFNIAMGLE
ncbi:hypothetical protein EIN_504860 [Entamoeba invadens IP1]|uniref:Uncharacterized protein n=1 Tax=Entamoeba invadens IP1 TaxID=370355 RepID=A0A0A1UAU5_ENTIV|nr:hypothetical protein EIN_504860 [Entamoeba invadens IP1]ELP90300.1 hypothetical protein EIN_504860 [Entamoeba invadens IP1]|eukprot:XP_004257071.1 hypothetical protein EIN_504860 [Entamoeba invadens IP1]